MCTVEAKITKLNESWYNVLNIFIVLGVPQDSNYETTGNAQWFNRTRSLREQKIAPAQGINTSASLQQVWSILKLFKPLAFSWRHSMFLVLADWSSEGVCYVPRFHYFWRWLLFEACWQAVIDCTDLNLLVPLISWAVVLWSERATKTRKTIVIRINI
jgi:hypothetical protein